MTINAPIGLHFLLTEWNWQPSIIGGTLLILVLYIYAVGPLRERFFPAEEFSMRKAIAFLVGVNLIFLSLFSALDELGDRYLFSAHMLQHLILTMVGPPLMLVGLPGWLIQPLLRNRVVLKIGKLLVHPAVAFTLFNADLWLWHAPLLYDATLFNENLHILEHLTFIIFGLLFWWPMFSPVKEGLPRLSTGGQILYLFFGSMPMVLLGAGLTFAPPLYAPYINAPRVWGLSPATDQQLGGLLMWVPVSLYTIAIMSVLFIHWMQRQEREQYEKERNQDLIGEVEPNLDFSKTESSI
ncbi:MAG TPA: cytochrome c oxidase assembly protein [Ktedonobacteraceae bacterium]|nr:cytochrome c oxidase assembly protein [Ktedonobacteraceae bacterium]